MLLLSSHSGKIELSGQVLTSPVEVARASAKGQKGEEEEDEKKEDEFERKEEHTHVCVF